MAGPLALRVRQGGCSSKVGDPAAGGRGSCVGEQLLYSAYLPLPADSAGFGLAQGSVHYLLIFTTLVPQFTSKFFLGFLAEIPGKKNLV